MTKFPTDAHHDPREKIVHLAGDGQKKNLRRFYGPTYAGKIPCGRKPDHGFYPANETCPECLSWLEEMDLARAKAATLPAPPPAPKIDLRSAGHKFYEYSVKKYGGPQSRSWHALGHQIQLTWERDASDIVADIGILQFNDTYGVTP